MNQDLERIEYRSGMLKAGMKPESLPAKAWRVADIPEDVKKAIDEEELRSLGGVYGNKWAGDPLEYDQLKLVWADAVVKITVFNRGIALFTSDDERICRIHRILCRLQKVVEG